jgi:hypothetical protein
MGARRFAPSVGRFLQVDYFNGALADLSLSSDPLTANRYGLAGGNPLSFIEWDGHTGVRRWARPARADAGAGEAIRCAYLDRAERLASPRRFVINAAAEPARTKDRGRRLRWDDLITLRCERRGSGREWH